MSIPPAIGWRTVPCGVALLALVLLTAPASLGAQMAAQGADRLASFSVPAACTDSTPLPPNIELDREFRSATPRAIVVPPLDPAPPPRGSLAVHFFVSARGAVDSVRIVGSAAEAYRQALRDRMLAHTFWPAVYRDCAVPSRVAIEFFFP